MPNHYEYRPCKMFKDNRFFQGMQEIQIPISTYSVQLFFFWDGPRLNLV